MIPTPAEHLARKTLVASGATAADWMTVAASIKNRAFFSSRIQSLRLLQTARETISDLLSAAPDPDGATTSRAQAVSAIIRKAKALGLDTGSPNLSNPASIRRAALIVDTNAAQAAGYTSYLLANSTAALHDYPAQELIRIEDRREKRNWVARWVAAGGKLYGNRRMIAPKGDPVWTRISTFGNPWPPFDFNSGMGIEDITREEAIRLGVIAPDQTPDSPKPENFNSNLAATIPQNQADTLRSLFQDQIQITPHPNPDDPSTPILTAAWQTQTIIQAATAAKNFTATYPPVTPAALTRIPTHLAAQIKDKPLRIESSWLKRHLKHFAPEENQPDNIPLTPQELELIPLVYREADRYTAATKREESKKSLVCELDDRLGSTYRLIVAANRTAPTVKTFYKLRTETLPRHPA